jgi:hypothetical protein
MSLSPSVHSAQRAARGARNLEVAEDDRLAQHRVEASGVSLVSLA